MDSLFISLNAVVPLFLMMAVGYIIRLTGLLNDISARQVNKCIFKVFLPRIMKLYFSLSCETTRYSGRVMYRS